MVGAEAATPTMDFFVVVATILPLLFLAGIVELRLSLTSRAGPPVEERLLPIGGEDDVEFIRSLVLLGLVIATIFGEFACLNALWFGRDTGSDGTLAAVCVGVDGFVLLLLPLRRWSTDVRASPATRKRVDHVLIGMAIAATTANVLVFVVGRFI
jgi:hypothetical protein